jgi:hypothetical protein
LTWQWWDWRSWRLSRARWSSWHASDCEVRTMEILAFVIAMAFFGVLIWEVMHPEKF